jgi:hypothetical protein
VSRPLLVSLTVIGLTDTALLPCLQHPCQDLAKGERLLKDVYEALRASPKWNNTMLLVSYDDIGGGMLPTYLHNPHPSRYNIIQP